MGSKYSPMYFMGDHLLKVRCMSGRGPDTALSPFSISCESHSQAGSASQGHNKVNAGTFNLMIITEIQIQIILLGNYSRMRCELEASLQWCRARGSPWPRSPSPAPWRQTPATLHMFKAQKQGAPPYQSSSSLVGLVWRNPSAEVEGTLLVLDFLSCPHVVNFLAQPAIPTWQSLSTSGRGWRTWRCPQGWAGSPPTRKDSRGSTTHRWLLKFIKTGITQIQRLISHKYKDYPGVCWIQLHLCVTPGALSWWSPGAWTRWYWPVHWFVSLMVLAPAPSFNLI